MRFVRQFIDEHELDFVSHTYYHDLSDISSWQYLYTWQLEAVFSIFYLHPQPSIHLVPPTQHPGLSSCVGYLFYE